MSEEYDLFGEKIEKNELLRDKFIEPPFSVLDTKSGSWQKRKQAWKAIGMKSEVGRGGDMTFNKEAKSFDYYRVKEGKKKESKEQGVTLKKPTVLDLFCGCGGLSYGFIQAGFNVVAGVDTDASALKTFHHSHEDSTPLELDISSPGAIKAIDEVFQGELADVIIGGPPCQGFSLTGPRNFNDDRNRLYLSFIKLVSHHRPQAFLIENVPGLATLYKGSIKQEIVKGLSRLGYNVSVEILCAADYGVPQMRKRLVFIGVKRHLGKFSFPPKTNTVDNYVTCEDAIGDLPSRETELGDEIDEYVDPPKTAYQQLMRKNASNLYNHVATNHTDKVKNVIALVPEGGNHKDLPKGIGEHRKFNEAWTRYHSKRPSRTIDTGHRNHFHYSLDRVPTIRENARLQSFPDDFVFYGNKTQQNRQVGNAVPPLLAYELAKRIREHLET